jgi:hypothetical protein
MTTIDESMTAAQFNKRFSIGKRFKYYPIKGRNKFKDVQTRSAAWNVGHNEAVVNITGQGGSVAICHLKGE